MTSNYYIDDDTLVELDILRRLANAEKALNDPKLNAVSADNSAIRSDLYRQIKRLVQDHKEFIRGTQERFSEAVGVIVGRFQLDKLHAGHKCLIETVRSRHQCYAVAIGITVDGTPTQKDPLSYHMRASMILEDFKDCVTFPIQDINDDDVWSKKLDEAIRQAFPQGTVRLYGGRDSFIPAYTGEFPTTEITAVDGTSGTEVRNRVGASPASNAEFRKGLIYGLQNTKENK